jgi:hypothetical protein
MSVSVGFMAVFVDIGRLLAGSFWAFSTVVPA